MIDQIRAKAREVLQGKLADCVIGYERASDGVSARPAFIYSPDDVGRLVFDQTCTHNLVRYLRDRKDKTTAVIVKACDARAINVLINEKQLAREKVYVIGVVCPGMKNASFGQAGDKLQGRCQSCRQHVPVAYDFLIGQPPPEPPGAPSYPDVAEFEAKPSAERRAFWAEQSGNCIRCYACRQSCPGCYCPECFADQVDPAWIGIRIAQDENQVWNVGRAFHLAGRCVDCGACEQACPMDIPLMLLNHKLEKDAAESFGFEAGLDADKAAPFATFKKEEKLEAAG